MSEFKKVIIAAAFIAFTFGMSVGIIIMGHVIVPNVMEVSWHQLKTEYRYCKEKYTKCTILSVKETK